MMQKFTRFLLQRGTFWVALLATIILIGLLDLPLTFMSVPVISQQTGGLPLLDMRAGYTAQDVMALFQAMPASARMAYQWMHLTLDLLFPLAYAVFFAAVIASALSRVYGKDSVKIRWAYLAFLSGGFDLLENFSIVALLAIYPNTSPFLANLAGVFTLVKYVCFILAMLAALILTVVAWFRRRKQPAK